MAPPLTFKTNKTMAIKKTTAVKKSDPPKKSVQAQAKESIKKTQAASKSYIKGGGHYRGKEWVNQTPEFTDALERRVYGGGSSVFLPNSKRPATKAQQKGMFNTSLATGGSKNPAFDPSKLRPNLYGYKTPREPLAKASSRVMNSKMVGGSKKKK